MTIAETIMEAESQEELLELITENFIKYTRTPLGKEFSFRDGSMLFVKNPEQLHFINLEDLPYV